MTPEQESAQNVAFGEQAMHNIETWRKKIEKIKRDKHWTKNKQKRNRVADLEHLINLTTNDLQYMGLI